jgi:hypothetical protein
VVSPLHSGPLRISDTLQKTYHNPSVRHPVDRRATPNIGRGLVTPGENEVPLNVMFPLSVAVGFVISWFDVDVSDHCKPLC